MTDQPALFDPNTPTTRTTPIPATNRPDTWLTTHLIRTGHLTETGLTRRARIRTCRTCRSLTIAGLDDHTCALEAHTDPTPLTPLAEALAAIEGRPTYNLHREGGHYVLDPRDPEHITAHPAGTRNREDVLRQHLCHTPPVPLELAAPTRYPEHTPPPPPGAHPPF